VLQSDPKNLTVLYMMAQNVLGSPSRPRRFWHQARKPLTALISNIDTFFDPSKKPATTSDADWAKAKTQTETLAHTSLGWIALQKKDNETAKRSSLNRYS